MMIEPGMNRAIMPAGTRLHFRCNSFPVILQRHTPSLQWQHHPMFPPKTVAVSRIPTSPLFAVGDSFSLTLSSAAERFADEALFTLDFNLYAGCNDWHNHESDSRFKRNNLVVVSVRINLPKRSPLRLTCR
jgi:hypothetical protein